MLELVFALVSSSSSRESCTERYDKRAPASARAYYSAFDSVFAAVGQQRNVDPALLKAIAWCETRLDPCAVSSTGAQGLMQFMPSTFDAVAEAASAEDPFDPTHSVQAAGVYIAALLNFWRGNLEAVVASYNAGPGAVARAIKRGRTIPAIAETQGYVVCVLDAYAKLTPRAPVIGRTAWSDSLLSFFHSPSSGASR